MANSVTSINSQATGDNVLVVNNMKKYFSTKDKDCFVKAIDDISFTVRRNEVVGLVGESGSGKSTTAYSIMGMHSITSGEVIFKGQDISMLAIKRPKSLKREIQIVFQDPGTSLNPQRKIGEIISMPLRVHNIVPRSQTEKRARELLDLVGLPQDCYYKSPRSLGGGEKQLVAIARALTTNPSLMILDEPTSALDVSIQAKIITTLMELREQFDMSYLFITHDMSLMRNIADRIAIMYLGRIMEMAPTADFFEKPQHPYTKMLVSSIPVVLQEEEDLKPVQVESQGEIPSPVNVPPGCRFNTRCPEKFESCLVDEPQMVKVFPDHYVSCHMHDPRT
ncbi:MAG: ABC transporter ATP-binding protein [Clostridiaceae bacterium]|nr:ABC transporter ATP-binding protein [Clostridiaceae bacterium]